MRSVRLFWWASVLAIVALNRPADAQVVTGQIHGMGIVTGTTLAGGGGAIYVSRGRRLDLGLNATLGNGDGTTVLRVETVALFHVNLPSSNDWGLYGGAGAAFETEASDGGEFLLLLVGIEPNRRRGPFVEVGVGGGLRVSAGFRFGRQRTSRR